jgi:putative transcriptional regulator
VAKAKPVWIVTNTIRSLRFHHGEMTQQALADAVGVTRQTINAIEGSKYSPSLELAFQIAKVFEVPLSEVFQYGPTA